MLKNSAKDASKGTDDRRHVVEAAAVAGAAAGIAVAGPALGIAVAAGAAYGAANDDAGAVGEAARVTGEAVIELEHIAVEWEEKNHILQRTAEKAQSKVEEAKAYEQEHHIFEKVKQIAENSFRAVVSFVQRHQLIEKGAMAVECGADFLTIKLRECSSKDTSV
jgi:Ribonuclease G/E